jgi:signal transduction histidine kinase
MTAEIGDETMPTGMRNSGIDVIGDLAAWGSHFCLFYETKEDLLDALISYYKGGLQRKEYCLWIVTEPLTIEEAKRALKDAVPDLDQHLADSSLEIISGREWYLQGGAFDDKRVRARWDERLFRVSAKGYAGMRVAGDTSWLVEKDWRHFCELKDWKQLCEHEQALNEIIGKNRLSGLCTYPLAACGALEILDVLRAHQFALARRGGSWEVVETAGFKQAKAEIKRLNEELEQRVLNRTSELMKASEALRDAQAELARVTRLTVMGELTASLAHEIKQPIGAAVTNAEACIRLLDRDQPDIPEAREAVLEMVKDARRAADIIDRVRLLYQKGSSQLNVVDVNEVIGEMVVMLQNEAKRNSVSMRIDLSQGLPKLMADRVQLQQALMNLMLNGIEATRDTGGELSIKSQLAEDGQLLISVTDTGVGLPAENVDKIFDAFFTTKPQGTGLGLAITRSIVKSHGGSIWASANSGRGTTFSFTLPSRVAVAA